MRRWAHRLAIWLERRWDEARFMRRAERKPRHLRIVPYLGHGGAEVVVRGRVLDNPEPLAAVAGERTWVAVKRTLARFFTDELPGVPLRIRLGAATQEVRTDAEGYFDLRVRPGSLAGPWASGFVELAAPYRGVTASHETEVRVRVPGPGAAYGVISDVDDTILVTGAQRAWAMVKQTFAGSALTRVTFPGTPELYRALGAGDANPIFYVSSSPWNLHAFLVGFLEHRGIPLGPLLLRDLLGADAEHDHFAHKLARITEVLGLQPDLSFVLIGDTGQHDPEIYAEVARRFPGRILAIYLREVRLDTADGRVEVVSDAWREPMPFVVAADAAAIAAHAAELGLITSADAEQVARATTADD